MVNKDYQFLSIPSYSQIFILQNLGRIRRNKIID